jgi:TatD DNase family protein
MTEPFPSRRMSVHRQGTFTDTHAHLSMVAHRLGRPALDALLARYADTVGEPALDGHDSAGSANLPEPLVLDPGVEADDLGDRVRLLAGYAFVRLAAGIWPSNEALKNPAAHFALLEKSIKEAGGASSIVAIGEGGLDYHHMNGEKEAQRKLFVMQLDLASRMGKPILVHSRDSAVDSLDILRSERPSVPVVLHCFGYGPDEAKAFLDCGCYISFAGNLTYRKAGALREACALVPAERLLLETDSPYMNPEPFRGRPSTPLDVERCYSAAATIRGIAIEELALLVSATAHRLFG